MARVISLANQKGGVGKTTTSFNLASALRQSQEARVLLIDNDPQGNLTSYALSEGTTPELTIDELYVSRKNPRLSLETLSKVSENFYLLASDQMLSGVEYYLASRTDKESVLKNALAEIRNEFDYVLIDNPPALSLLTINGLVASDYVLVPVQLEFFSLEGIVQLQRTLELVKDRNPELKFLGIVPNMFDDRRKLNWEVLEALKKQFGDLVLETKIHNSVKLAESSGYGKSILTYAPASRPSQEFLSLADEISRQIV